jgi:aminomethyltransferase
MPPEKAVEIWQLLLKNGATPAGLGCRDTLRFEAGLPLYGHEISDAITPLEGGLAPFVRLEKGEFIGRDALVKPQPRKQIGLAMAGRAPARAGYKVFAGGAEVGVVTTGSFGPTVGKNLANCCVAVETPADAVFEVEIRGKRESAVWLDLPFYSIRRKS